MTLLHAAVRCDPPLELVLEMFEICADASCMPGLSWSESTSCSCSCWIEAGKQHQGWSSSLLTCLPIPSCLRYPRRRDEKSQLQFAFESCCLQTMILESTMHNHTRTFVWVHRWGHNNNKWILRTCHFHLCNPLLLRTVDVELLQMQLRIIYVYCSVLPLFESVVLATSEEDIRMQYIDSL
jgi:hypothetical protein